LRAGSAHADRFTPGGGLCSRAVFRFRFSIHWFAPGWQLGTAGSVVIGGDAVNDVLTPPRKYSTSDQVEKLAKGADIIVHSAIHPIMGPGMGSDMYPYAFYRQSTATDIGAMAQNTSCLHI